MKSRKLNLVVIGNGMAGARTVEEILARGGAEQFNIAMFGGEPFGNYNRIMLSGVLWGERYQAILSITALMAFTVATYKLPYHRLICTNGWE